MRLRLRSNSLTEYLSCNMDNSLPVADLKTIARDVYSQCGEDGVIDWLFSRLPARHRICVEFGAWDGRKLSNTFNLVENCGWKAVYIEADSRKFRDLKKTAAAYPAITPVHGLVATAGPSSLDALLERERLPADFDLLSIDIDGNEYDVWQSTTRFAPRLVVIEHNATFPPGFEFVDRGGRSFIGSSAASLCELAASKGYGLLGANVANLFFLRAEDFPVLGVRPLDVGEVPTLYETCYVLFNHAGEVVLSNAAVARKLRGVRYARRLKTWTRRVLRMPTFYALGESRTRDGAVLSALRRLVGG